MGKCVMKIKTFRSLTYIGIENKVNEFLKDTSIEIINVKFSTTIFDYGVMVLYKEITK